MHRTTRCKRLLMVAVLDSCQEHPGTCLVAEQPLNVEFMARSCRCLAVQQLCVQQSDYRVAEYVVMPTGSAKPVVRQPLPDMQCSGNNRLHTVKRMVLR
jgi:hypothetical protein